MQCTATGARLIAYHPPTKLMAGQSAAFISHEASITVHYGAEKIPLRNCRMLQTCCFPIGLRDGGGI